MSFPLKRWIDDHSDVPHNLATSGMRGTLASTSAALRRPMPADDAALRTELAERTGVAPDRLFLTHGATEANTLVLSFLARTSPAPGICSVPRPEYPSLADTALWTGWAVVRDGQRADVAALSDPNNPTGLAEPSEIPRLLRAHRAVLVDETFREFARQPSHAAAARPGLWATGSFTKFYAGDDLRVGYAVAPPEAAERFGEFHGVVLDEVPAASVSGARAILRDHESISAEVQERLAGHRRLLAERLPSVPVPHGPVCFARFGEESTDGVAEQLLRAGILVAPGRYFGDPSGMRLGLTRPTFPADLEAFVRARGAHPRRGTRPPAPRRPMRATADRRARWGVD